MKDKINYVQVPGYTEPEQLLNLLKAAGFTTVARTTERLLKTKDGTYSLPLFRINEKNEAIGLSMRESLEVAEELPKVHSIASLLADRYMSDIDLVDKHPETGEHHRGLGYVSARIKGILQPYKQVGGVLIQSYIQGIMTEKNVAANAFWPVMVSHRRMMTAAYRPSFSMHRAFRFSCSQAMTVVPDPANRSRTMSPCSVLLPI